MGWNLDCCAVDPGQFDLVVLGMQEAQYSSEGVRELMARVAAARTPCLAIMNMPPLPYLERIPGLSIEPLKQCYVDPTVWEGFEPGLVTLASPDPQAYRPGGVSESGPSAQNSARMRA